MKHLARPRHPKPTQSHRRHARGAALLLAAAWAAIPGFSTAAVYRCTAADAPPRFSQFPCGDGSAVTLEPLHTVRIPPLSQGEQSLLAELERQQREAQAERARVRRRASLEAHNQREERRQRCEAARAARVELQRQRRKGYSLGEARALERRDAELEAAERQNC